MKETMFNEFEATTAEAVEDFREIDSMIRKEIKVLSNKYRLVEIEHYLVGAVSCECAELRLRNARAMKQKRKEKKEELRNETNHKCRGYL